MGYGRFSDPTVTDWINSVVAMNLWAALFHSDPFAGDPLLAEIVGGSYIRVPYTIEVVAFNLIRNSNVLAWLGLPAGTNIVAVGVFDAETSGVFRFGSLLDTPYPLPSGGSYSVGAGLLPAGVDVAVGP